MSLNHRKGLKRLGSCLSRHERCVFSAGHNWCWSIFLFAARRDKNVIQEVFDDLAATQSFRTLDLMNRMRTADAGRPAYFKKDIHFNEYGHQVVAEALREYLLAHGLINSASTSRERLNN